MLSERPTGFSKYIKTAFEDNLKLLLELAKIVGGEISDCAGAHGR